MAETNVVELRPNDHAPDDASLVDQAQDGATWAEEALYRRHGREVYSVVLRLIGNTADADDIVQDAFITAFERLGQLREPGAFRGWLLSIAVRAVHRLFRRRALLHRLGFSSRPDEVSLVVAEGASPELRAQIAEIEDILNRAGPAQRICWMLRHVEGYTLREVAKLAGCSLATAKRRIAAAHKHLEHCIDREDLP